MAELLTQNEMLTFGGVIMLLLFVSIVKSIYNLTLHPLSHIPGPKLAAISSLYEFYWDVIRDGKYIFEIEKMHAKYAFSVDTVNDRTDESHEGPIVRINPNELHIHDPEYYSTIYCGGTRKVEKDPSTVTAFSVPTSVAATVDHHLHRARRGYLNPYFSKRAIVSLEGLIHERTTRLFGRFQEAIATGETVSLDKAFSAMTADIITTRLYGYNCDYVDVKDFVFPVRNAFLGVSLIFHLARFFPHPVRMIKKLPNAIIRLILPSVADFLVFQDAVKKSMTESLASKSFSEQEKKSVIIQALSDDRIPPNERTLPRLLDEGTVIIFAGTETSSRALAVGMFYMYDNKSLVMKLREELKPLSKIPDEELTLVELEALPYLTGVVNESLRLSFGPVSRLPRIATEAALEYKDVIIPPGYPVSQSTYLMHTDPSIYPNPRIFNPDRWVKAAEEGVQLTRYMVSFTKGSRQCLGIGMAYAELYLVIARCIRKFDMDLIDTTVDDVGVANVRIVGYPKKIKGKGDTQGEVTVKITGMTASEV
ncbi:cytochrome p450 protein [Rutstroemia sp. NJR-2017a WRK4]|nr:cytochrome p450 protein [Rutstroemia sp. NJR-2017a WRK4]